VSCESASGTAAGDPVGTTPRGRPASPQIIVIRNTPPWKRYRRRPRRDHCRRPGL